MKQIYVLGMIVAILLLLWLGSDILKLAQQPVQEGFATATTNITLNFCPSWAPQAQTAKGNTDCCEGDIVDGKCNGKTFCTLSPPHDGIQSCLDAWKKYYANKSASQCPPTLPNYFEDQKNKQAPMGCSSSLTMDDGSKPKDGGAPRCRVYRTEKENREMRDSCFVEKGRLAVKCPPFAGYTSKVELVTMKEGGVDKFGSYVCTYVNPMGQRNSCNDEKSLIAMWDRQNPNWRMNNSKYAELRNISCSTFIERERQKELERQRAEAERRRAEEEKRKREAQANRFRSFFSRFRQSAQNQVNRVRQALEEQKRRAAEQKRAADRRLQEMRNRLKVCK
jgi:hypothetical protein